MNVIETVKAAEYLRQFGYAVEEKTDRVVVRDPVQCSTVGKKWIEYKDVTLRSSKQIAKFVADRS